MKVRPNGSFRGQLLVLALTAIAACSAQGADWSVLVGAQTKLARQVGQTSAGETIQPTATVTNRGDGSLRLDQAGLRARLC